MREPGGKALAVKRAADQKGKDASMGIYVHLNGETTLGMGYLPNARKQMCRLANSRKKKQPE